jgi:acetolactate synthase-1/2/3 large subunit
LQTVRFNKLPIKIFIINNQGYGIIKQFQSLYLKNRFEASIPSKGVTNPDFEKISRAYGLDYYKINTNTEIEKILKKIFSTNRPEIIEVFLKPNQKIIPKLEFGRPIEDLSPLLPRKELNKIMINRVVKDFKKIIQV